ncbi:hypothetical protein DFJ63DRAFT_338607 [Scheffersomyces coipomensis]|uniref:uncharacterized protein n=1 Tax=Scheffersomyces coipomensis TaxID=1788519 RepID=UPI00315C8147
MGTWNSKSQSQQFSPVSHDVVDGGDGAQVVNCGLSYSSHTTVAPWEHVEEHDVVHPGNSKSQSQQFSPVSHDVVDGGDGAQVVNCGLSYSSHTTVAPWEHVEEHDVVHPGNSKSQSQQFSPVSHDVVDGGDGAQVVNCGLSYSSHTTVAPWEHVEEHDVVHPGNSKSQSQQFSPVSHDVVDGGDGAQVVNCGLSYSSHTTVAPWEHVEEHDVVHPGNSKSQSQQFSPVSHDVVDGGDGAQVVNCGLSYSSHTTVAPWEHVEEHDVVHPGNSKSQSQQFSPVSHDVVDGGDGAQVVNCGLSYSSHTTVAPWEHVEEHDVVHPGNSKSQSQQFSPVSHDVVDGGDGAQVVNCGLSYSSHTTVAPWEHVEEHVVVQVLAAKLYVLITFPVSHEGGVGAGEVVKPVSTGISNSNSSIDGAIVESEFSAKPIIESESPYKSVIVVVEFEF